MPALTDVFLPHADPDPRTDLVSGDRGRKEFSPRYRRIAFQHRKNRRQGDGPDMEHTYPMDIIKFKALDQCAIREHRMRRGQTVAGSPDRR